MYIKELLNISGQYFGNGLERIKCKGWLLGFWVFFSSLYKVETLRKLI